MSYIGKNGILGSEKEGENTQTIPWKSMSHNDLAPQVGFEPTTLRLTAEMQCEAMRTAAALALNLK